MKRRILSLILAVCLLLSCLPGMAWAEEEDGLPAEAPAVSAPAPDPEPEAPAAPKEPEPEPEAPAEAPETPVAVTEEPEGPKETSAPEEPVPAEEPEVPEEPVPAEEPETPEEPVPAEEPETPEEPVPAEEPETPEEPAPAEEPETPEEPLPEEEPEVPGEPLPEEEWDAELMAYTILTPVNFPDPAFRYALYTLFGPLTAADAALVDTLDVSGQGIEDLTGIRFFPNLTVLDCSDNYIDVLSLSSLRYLEALDCSGNGLEVLSVRSCGRLLYIDASDNDLESLDVSGLYRLDTLDVSANPLATLKVKSCGKLNTVYFSAADLITLDAADCNSLVSLDLSAAVNLVSLDVRDCIGLVSLTVASAKLKTLRVSGCISLTGLDCSHTSVSSLDLTGCTSLVALDCSFCMLTSLTVRACPHIAYIDCSGNFLSTLSLPYLNTLQVLACAGNELTSLDLTGCMSLETLTCGDNRLSSLILTDCFSIETLTCEDNRLAALDLAELPSLITLDCSGNEIAVLRIEKCPSLTSLTCGGNRLLHLDKTAVAGLTAADLGEQHPAVTLTAYLPDEEDPPYAFADLRELISDDETSLVSVTSDCLNYTAYLPVLPVDTETLTYTIAYPGAPMKVTVAAAYTVEPPFTSAQSYFLLDQAETLSNLSDFIHFGAFSGTSAWGVLWQAWNTEETSLSTVIGTGSDSVTAQQAGTAILYANPYLTYKSVKYWFTPVRFRVDVAENPSGPAVDDVIGISVPESAKTVELFSTSYTRIELLLERDALKGLASSGRLVDQSDIEPVGEFTHSITAAGFVDPDTADIFELYILDDRTLVIVPKYIALQAAWYQPRFVKATYRSTVWVTLDNGETFITNRITISVKQTKPSVSASSVNIDTLDIFAAGSQTSFPIEFKSSAPVIAAEPDPDRTQPLPDWLSLDGEGLEFIYAGDEDRNASGYAYLLVTLEGWAIKVPVKVKVKATCSLVMRFEKKHIYLRADGADSDLVCFTTRPLSVRGIDFFRDNAALTVATEKGYAYNASDLFSMVEYYDGATGYYGWHLQVIPGSPADDGRAHSYTVSLVVADRTVYFYVKVVPFTTRPTLTVKNGGAVDMSVPGSYTTLKLTLKNMNLAAEDGAGHPLVVPTFRVTLGSPYGTDITSLFLFDLDPAAGEVRVTLNGYLPLGKTYTAFLWAEVDNGGFARATAYGRFSVKESPLSKVRPSFTLRRYGTVDTSRELTFVRLVPSVRNFPQYDLNDCSFTFYQKIGGHWTVMSNWNLYFDVIKDTVNGCFYLSAADPYNYPLTPGNGYAFTATWLFDGVPYTYGTPTRPVIIPVRQYKAVFTVTPANGTLSRLDNAAELLLTFTAKDGSVNPVDHVTLDKTSSNYFTVTGTDIAGVFRLGWLPTAPRNKLRAGSTRTVTLQIFLKGNSTTKPNATVKLKVKLA